MTSGMISLSSKDQPCWRTSVSPQQQRPSAVARSLSAQLGAAPGEERQAILSFLDSVSDKHHQSSHLQSGVMEISNRTETHPRYGTFACCMLQGESRLFSRSCSSPVAEPATHTWPLTPQQLEQAQQQRVPPSSKVRGVAVMTTTMPVSCACFLPAHSQAGQLSWGYM